MRAGGLSACRRESDPSFETIGSVGSITGGECADSWVSALLPRCAGGGSVGGFSGATGSMGSAGPAAECNVAELVPVAGVGRVRRVGRGGGTDAILLAGLVDAAAVSQLMSRAWAPRRHAVWGAGGVG